MTKLDVTVPTKAILFGEHLILRGCEALAIPLRSMPLVLHGTHSPGPLNIIVPEGIDAADVHDLLEFFHIREGQFEFSTDSGFPPSAGAGISAAWSVALLRWFQEFLRRDEGGLELLDKLEQRHHGRASGLDVRTIFYDRPVAFRNSNFDVLDDAILDTIPLKKCEFLVSGKPHESTREMIAIVEKNSDKIDTSKLPNVDYVLQILNENRSEDFKKVLNFYGTILEGLGAVPSELASEFEKLRSQGFGVKVSGAGGRTGGAGLTILLK